MRPDERGQTSAEHLGVIALVAAVVVALFGLGIPQTIAGALGRAVCTITGGERCETDAPPAAKDDTEPDLSLA